MPDAAIFGLIVADLIASPMDLRPPPPPGQLVVIQSLEFTTGGNVCNTGMAMAGFGLKVAAAGLVGKDVLGTAIIERMKTAGLDASAVVETDKAQTSATLVAVEPGGERVFFHTPGATTLLDAWVFRRCFPLFEKCTFVHIGYFGLLPALTPDLPAVLAQLKSAAPRVRVALDTVNPPGDWTALQPILPHVDVFCPSRTEATALTGETEPRKMVAAFRPFMPRGLIGIKLDVDGCFLDDGATSIHLPAYKIDCVDTTGAGDTWYAGLLTGLIKGMPLAEAGRFANRAAADCCTALGASAGVKPFEDTLARM